MNEPNINQAQKSLISALLQIFGARPTPPTKAEVETTAKMFAPTVPYTGDLLPVIEEVLIEIDTKMGLGTSLIDFEAKHDEEWIDKRSDIDWVYTKAYAGFLESEKWNPNVVQNLSDVSNNILGLLQDPASEGIWNRRGLVIGHVQSGKTANYLAVLARAADAGYKFIIVIAGIHNNLRKQTQERIDAGFVGRSSDPENRKLIGVGKSGYPHPATLTNIYNDFNKATAGHSGWKLNDFSKPIILVIKKNVSTLKSLHNWLKELNTKGDGRISDVPMLMIDDEADNASINTNKPELDPTKTNFLLRKILGLFDKSCYVGYTATPFANIFINPEAYDTEAREELFPKDFIYCLDAPTTYFGPEKVFIDDESSARILRRITDGEEYLPLTHKRDHDIKALPPSLYEAINQFILVKAIRNLRGHYNKHSSMMINVSRFVDIQNTVRGFVSRHIRLMEDAVGSNYAMAENISSKNEFMQALKNSFIEQFSACDHTWQEVKASLNSVFATLKTVVINSKSQDSLNYGDYEEDGNGLTAIAIGGLSLSRGLTIEGLCVSYMYRNTKMYDTLMQMGRWFGYRTGFDDLCRVHLSEDSANWYAHIAKAAEELRSQIKQMRRDRLSPKQFGLYVKAHPDTLLITAANKMRAGTETVLEQNFSGKLVESYVLPTAKKINEKNTLLIEQYWRTGFGEGEHQLELTKKGWIIRDVPAATVEAFLHEFKTHSRFALAKGWAIDYLNRIVDSYPVVDVLLISTNKTELPSKPYRLGVQQRTWIKQENCWLSGKMRVASRGDEQLGLDDAQTKKAESAAAPKKPSDKHFREVRDKPLLMLHNIKLEDKSSQTKQENAPAFGISFPSGIYAKSIKVVVNTVWLEDMMGSISDTPDEEDDYDA